MNVVRRDSRPKRCSQNEHEHVESTAHIHRQTDRQTDTHRERERERERDTDEGNNTKDVCIHTNKSTCSRRTEQARHVLDADDVCALLHKLICKVDIVLKRVDETTEIKGERERQTETETEREKGRVSTQI